MSFHRSISIHSMRKNLFTFYSSLWIFKQLLQANFANSAQILNPETVICLSKDIHSPSLNVSFNVGFQTDYYPKSETESAGSSSSIKSKVGVTQRHGFFLSLSTNPEYQQYPVEDLLSGAYISNPIDPDLKVIFEEFFKYSIDEVYAHKDKIIEVFSRVIQRADFGSLYAKSVYTNKVGLLPFSNLKHNNLELYFCGSYPFRLSKDILWFLMTRVDAKSNEVSKYGVIVCTPKTSPYCEAVLFTTNQFVRLNVEKDLYQQSTNLFGVIVACEAEISKEKTSWKSTFKETYTQPCNVLAVIVAIIFCKKDNPLSNWYLFNEEFYFYLSCVQQNISFGKIKRNILTKEVKFMPVYTSIHLSDEGFSLIYYEKSKRKYIELLMKSALKNGHITSMSVFSANNFIGPHVRSVHRSLPIINLKYNDVVETRQECVPSFYHETLIFISYLIEVNCANNNVLESAAVHQDHFLLSFTLFDISIPIVNGATPYERILQLKDATFFEFSIKRGENQNQFYAILFKSSTGILVRVFDLHCEFKNGFQDVLNDLLNNKKLPNNPKGIAKLVHSLRYVQYFSSELLLNIPEPVYDFLKNACMTTLKHLSPSIPLKEGIPFDIVCYTLDQIGFKCKLFYEKCWIGVIYIRKCKISVFIKFHRLEDCIAPIYRFASLKNRVLEIFRDKNARCIEIWGNSILQIATWLHHCTRADTDNCILPSLISDIDTDTLLQKHFSKGELEFFFESYLKINSAQKFFRMLNIVYDIVLKGNINSLPLMFRTFDNISIKSYCQEGVKEVSLDKHLIFFLIDSSKVTLDISNDIKISSAAWNILCSNGSYMVGGKTSNLNFDCFYSKVFAYLSKATATSEPIGVDFEVFWSSFAKSKS